MGNTNVSCLFTYLLLPLIFHFHSSAIAYKTDNPSTSISKSWLNYPSNETGHVLFAEGSSLRPILIRYDTSKNRPPLCLGFFSNKTSSPPNTFNLVLVLVQELRPEDKDHPDNNQWAIDEFSALIILWAANRDRPVGENATLDFTAQGDLILREKDGSLVWSTRTSGRAVSRMEISMEGNLVLLTSNNDAVWQSFDFPVDTWLPNQKINYGGRLISRNASADLSSGNYYLAVTKTGLDLNSSTPGSGPQGNHGTLIARKSITLSSPGLDFGQNKSAGIDFYPTYAQFTTDVTTDGFEYIYLEPNGNLFLYKSERINKYDFPSMITVDILKDVMNGRKSSGGKRPVYLVAVLAPALSVVFVSIALIVGIWYFFKQQRNKEDDVEEEGDDQVVETLTKFTFEEMKCCTKSFQIKLGGGGFGSVFEGKLRDGRKVAVKCLESMGQGKKEFLAEVNTIGKVDHFNLVRLIGYCTDKSHRLLVYEYMCNGSLDKWIFNPQKSRDLTWTHRQKIIHGVAKGLEYLHEACSRNIIHFDIKPQNILLDRDFNPKISDFGLAKLIDQSQSMVLTALKGTPGYLAPELLGCINISVKADVYSFGIVILEIVCGRKNLDLSEPIPLLDIVKQKTIEGRLEDLIEGCSEDIRSNREEALNMIKVALWCLQIHYRRPSMSMVVKVLEGSTEGDLVTDPQFLAMGDIDIQIQLNTNISIPLGVSIALSGPR
ncbi:Non-specific serine/threonine protein kinase [Bertholletia excelsa]